MVHEAKESLYKKKTGLIPMIRPAKKGEKR
jgi:hypothetical protein